MMLRKNGCAQRPREPRRRWPAVPSAAQVLALEEFTVREGLLLTESLARALGINFSWEAAEPFVAYTGSDPFVLQSVVRGAAAAGTPLDSPAAFVRAYLDQLWQGSLAAYFRERLPAEPGSLERRFALETLSAGTLEASRLARWRHRIAVDDLLHQMQQGGWVSARGAHWALRSWPAARDWATLEASTQGAGSRGRPADAAPAGRSGGSSSRLWDRAGGFPHCRAAAEADANGGRLACRERPPQRAGTGSLPRCP